MLIALGAIGLAAILLYLEALYVPMLADQNVSRPVFGGTALAYKGPWRPHC